MNSIKVKICGIRIIEAAQVAVDEGVDFLGFNFVKTSKRYIDPEVAKKIIDQIRIRNYELRIKVVGVFQNADVNEVNKISDMLTLDLVQLHGDETEEYMKKIKKKIIKKVDERDSSTSLHFARNDSVRYLLLDRKIQGQGKRVNLEKAKELADIFPMFFSGGLTPENVSGVIKKIKPFAVDVAGGIETDGRQDLTKIREFIRKAKSL